MGADTAGGSPREFSLALRTEVAKALSAYLARGDAARGRLHRATQRVCAEAHALQLSPERMIEALRQMFETTPLVGEIHPARRASAWEEFMQSCIAAYYNADEGKS